MYTSLHHFTLGFSLTDWQSKEGITPTIPIDSGSVDNLMTHLGVTPFMLEPACSPYDPRFSDAAEKWKKCK